MKACAAFSLAGLLCATPALALDVTFAGKIEQGGLILGTAPPGSRIVFGGRVLSANPAGGFVIGLDRDAPAAMDVTVASPTGETATRTLSIAPRAWQIERVDGVPQALVTPDPETAARIAADSKILAEVRAREIPRPFYEDGFIRPAEGRISGVFGSQRILNGEPRAPHAGMDIAAPIGAPVRAAAGGVVTLAKPDMVLTGQTVVINHGAGLQTVYVHMSRIDVREGQEVNLGDSIGAVGMTGRANGPHLHFGVWWFDTRLDPETVLAALPAR